MAVRCSASRQTTDDLGPGNIWNWFPDPVSPTPFPRPRFLRGLDAGVAEHFLNVADARAAAKHPRRASVAQAVVGGGRGQVDLLRVGPHEAQQAGGRERMAGAGEEEALVAVEVVEGELAKLARAEAAGVEQLEHAAVAEAFGAAGVGGVDEGVDLRGREDVARQGFRPAQRRKLRGVIDEDVLPLMEPAEEAFHGPDSA